MDKKKFIDLRSQHHFEITLLAEKAMVQPEIVYHMLLGNPVPRDYAIMVLNALSQQTGSIYTLDNIDVKVGAL
jgi:hypothetical protein